jgi:hypothetical protein
MSVRGRSADFSLFQIHGLGGPRTLKSPTTDPKHTPCSPHTQSYACAIIEDFEEAMEAAMPGITAATRGCVPALRNHAAVGPGGHCTLLATSSDAVQLKNRGFDMRADEING